MLKVSLLKKKKKKEKERLTVNSIISELSVKIRKRKHFRAYAAWVFIWKLSCQDLHFQGNAQAVVIQCCLYFFKFPHVTPSVTYLLYSHWMVSLLIIELWKHFIYCRHKSYI